MANLIYPKWKEAALQAAATASLGGTGATGVFAVLVDTALYTYSATHEFYSSLAGIVGTEQELITKTFANGLFKAADISFPAVTGASIEAVVLFVKNAGANTTWRLFKYIDTATGLPKTPDGTAIPVLWNASGIVQL